MKSFKFLSENNKNDSVEEQQILENKNYSQFSKYVLNPFTIEKDLKIAHTYATPFLQFFQSGSCTSLPMFTYPPEPRSVKRVVSDFTFPVSANNPFSLYVNPFDYRNVYFINGTRKDSLFSPDTTKTFASYQVVCAKIIIKQVGIMSLTDGYGTVMDAVVVGPTIEPDWLENNLLSVQAGPGHKVMMVDGRVGVQANFIGSPLYKKIYPYVHMLPVDGFAVGDANLDPPLTSMYIPGNSTMTQIAAPSGTFYHEDGSSYVPFTTEIIHDPNAIVGISGNSVLIGFPEGEALFVRVSPPSINITIKVYVDCIIEGVVKSKDSTNMPQIIPPNPFDFQRVKYALANIIPSLVTLDSMPKEALLNIGVQMPMMVGHAATGKLKGNKIVTKKNKVKPIPKKVLQDPYYGESIYIPGKTDTELFTKKKRKRPEKTVEEILEDIKEEKKFKSFLKKNKISDNFKVPQSVQEFLDTGDYLSQDFENKKGIGYAMDNPNPDILEVKRRVKKKAVVNRSKEINLPEQIKNASDFLGIPSTELRSNALTNRLFQDATTALPQASYQYFPLVVEKKAIPTCVAMIKGNSSKCDKVLKIKVTNTEGKEADLILNFCSSDFQNPQEFVQAWVNIVNFAYGYAFHHVPKSELSVKFFSQYKIADTSYMYALLMCLYGAPSGGYYTGSFTAKISGAAQINDIPKETLAIKVASAAPEYPLNVLDSKASDGQFINMIAGVVVEYEEGQMIATDDLRLAILYGCVPFKTRTIKTTPFSAYTLEDKQYVLTKYSKPWRLYAVASNLKKPDKIRNFLENGITNARMFSRSDPANFSCYIANKKNKYVTAKHFYQLYPDMWNDGEGWRFKYDGEYYVDRNKFRYDIRKAGFKPTLNLTDNIALKLDGINENIYKINDEDVKKAKREMIDRSNDIKLKMNNNIEDMVQKDIEKGNKDELLMSIQEKMKPMATILANLKEFILANAGTGKKVVKSQNSAQALSFLNMANTVSSQAKPEDNEAVQEFIKFSDSVGESGPYVIAWLMGWELRNQPNPKKQLLQKISDYLDDFNENHKEIKPVNEYSEANVNKERKFIRVKVSSGQYKGPKISLNKDKKEKKSNNPNIINAEKEEEEPKESYKEKILNMDEMDYNSEDEED